jgi:hypothetical protein
MLDAVEIQMPRLSRIGLKGYLLNHTIIISQIDEAWSDTDIAEWQWKKLLNYLEAVFATDPVLENPLGFIQWFIHLQNFVTKDELLLVVREIRADHQKSNGGIE